MLFAVQQGLKRREFHFVSFPEGKKFSGQQSKELKSFIVMRIIE